MKSLLHNKDSPGFGEGTYSYQEGEQVEEG